MSTGKLSVQLQLPRLWLLFPTENNNTQTRWDVTFRLAQAGIISGVDDLLAYIYHITVLSSCACDSTLCSYTTIYMWYFSLATLCACLSRQSWPIDNTMKILPVWLGGQVWCTRQWTVMISFRHGGLRWSFLDSGLRWSFLDTVDCDDHF